jgi:hypothetical protein
MLTRRKFANGGGLVQQFYPMSDGLRKTFGRDETGTLDIDFRGGPVDNLREHLRAGALTNRLRTIDRPVPNRAR